MKNNFFKYLMTGIIVPSLMLGSNNLNAKDLEIVATQIELVQKVPKGDKISTSQLIKRATLEDCLEFVEECKNNSPIDDQIEKYGKGDYQNGIIKVAENMAELKCAWLNLAEKYANTNERIPDREYLEIARRNGKKQTEFYKGHTNQEAKGVVRVQAETGKIATKYYLKLIEENPQQHLSKNDPNDYIELVRDTFKETEYKEYCNNLADSMDNYYGELYETLGWKKVFGKEKIVKMKKASRTHYFGIKDKVFPKSVQTD